MKPLKVLTTSLYVLLIISNGFSQRKPENQQPIIITPTSHDPGFKSRLKSTTVQSFYKSKDDWQVIIDTTWGTGLPINEKLNIFNTYTSTLTEKFDGFNSLGIDQTEWDSIKNSYLNKINDSTSCGAFASSMSRLAYDLYDVHTCAWDSTVLFSPLNPGTPVLVLGRSTIEHFGAVLTLLSDSTLLVLRTIENHPLDLQPGDIVLGYEGIAWKDLVDELLEADIPILAIQCGAKSASRHFEMVCAGMNWHLFDSIDIVKYTSGDTVRLPVDPLLELPVPTGTIWLGGENLMWNNEQLPVPGIPFPDPEQFYEQAVTYGIIEGTNIGYIYLYVEAINGLFGLTYDVDPQFYEAVSSLLETEGLIIDLRLNYGGYADYRQVEELLFNQYLPTLNDAYRCSQDNFSLCPAENYSWYEIGGNPSSLYDRPLAILLGPHCGSMGDITAYYMNYHPMEHSFGKSPCASLGDNEEINTFPGWRLRYSKSDMYCVNDSGTYLNRREFAVDVPVWFNADDAASGVDPVVQSAMEWMQNLSYAHDVSAEPTYNVPATDTLTITAQVENPDSHVLSVRTHITDVSGLVIDSTTFYDDGNHSDGDPGDGTWGALWSLPSGEETYTVNVSTEDNAAGSIRTLPGVVRFTSIGPVVYDEISFTEDDTIPNSGDEISFKITLHNNGLVETAVSLGAKLTSLDTFAILINDTRPFPDIPPGEISTNFNTYKLSISENCPDNAEIHVKIDITSDGYTFWRDTFSIFVQEPTSIEDIRKPVIRIYPNPTNDVLNIEISNAGIQGIEIEILTVTGSVIYKKEFKNTSAHFSQQIDLSGYTKGIYMIKVMQADAVHVRKIIVK